jgi:WD40 repeat protein
VAVSSDSGTLATGAGDAVRLWRVSTGAPLRTLTAPSVSSVTFIGSATVAAGGFDSHVRLWRTSDGALVTTIGHHAASIRSVTFAPNETLLASGSEDFTAKLWRSADGTDQQTLAEHIDVVNAVAFSPDSQLVATAAGSPPPDTRDTRIKIWRVGTAASLLTLPGHANGSTGVAFSADGQTLVSSGRDSALRFWRVSDGALIRAVTQGNPIGPLAVSSDRSIVAVPGRNLTINLYSVADGTLLRVPQAANGSVSSLSFSGDGTLLAVGEEVYGDNIQIFNVSDGSLARTLPGDPNGFIQGVAFAPNGTTLASASGFSRTIQLWDPATGTPARQLRPGDRLGALRAFADCFRPLQHFVRLRPQRRHGRRRAQPLS